MKFKFLSMMLFLALSMCLFSCSKNEETSLDKVLTNVDNSLWRAAHNGGIFGLSFNQGFFDTAQSYGLDGLNRPGNRHCRRRGTELEKD